MVISSIINIEILISAALIIQINCCCRPQGFDRRVRNPEVPSAWHARRPPARPSSHPHQEVPSKCRHGHVVPHLHVGSHLLTVNKLNVSLNVTCLFHILYFGYQDENEAVC